jgi:hypothetical protein
MVDTREDLYKALEEEEEEKPITPALAPPAGRDELYKALEAPEVDVSAVIGGKEPTEAEKFYSDWLKGEVRPGIKPLTEFLKDPSPQNPFSISFGAEVLRPFPKVRKGVALLSELDEDAIEQAMGMSIVDALEKKTWENPHINPFSLATQMPANLGRSTKEFIQGTTALLGAVVSAPFRLGRAAVRGEVVPTVKELMIRSIETNDPYLMDWVGENFVAPAVREQKRLLVQQFKHPYKHLIDEPLDTMLNAAAIYQMTGSALRNIGNVAKKIGTAPPAKLPVPTVFASQFDDTAKFGAKVAAEVADDATVELSRLEKLRQKVHPHQALHDVRRKVYNMGRSLTATDRDPIVIKLGTDPVTGKVKDLHIPRQYSRNPIGKGITIAGENWMENYTPGLQKAYENYNLRKHFMKDWDDWHDWYYNASRKEFDYIRRDLYQGMRLDPKKGGADFYAVAEGLADYVPYHPGTEKMTEVLHEYKKFRKGVETKLLSKKLLAPEQVKRARWQPLFKSLDWLDEQGQLKHGMTLDDGVELLKKTYGPDWEPDPIYMPHLSGLTPKDFFIQDSPLQYVKKQPWQKERIMKGPEAWQYLRDPVEATVQNMASIKRMEWTNDMVNMVLNKYAVPLAPGELPANGYKAFAPGGFLDFYKTKYFNIKDVQTLINPDDTLALAGFLDEMFVNDKTLADYARTGIMVKKGKMYQIPETVYKQVASVNAPYSAFARILKKPTDVWRDMVLAFTGRWQFNNLIGGGTLATMEGAKPRHMMMLAEPRWKESIPLSVMQGGFMKAQKHQQHLGKASNTWLGKMMTKAEYSKFSRGWRKTADYLYDLNGTADEVFRASVYTRYCDDLVKENYANVWKGWRQPKSFKERMNLARITPALKEEAARRVNEYMYNFTRMSAWERRNIKPILPFYTWTKYMGLYGVRAPFRRPFKVKALKLLSESAYDITGQDNIPEDMEWLKGSIKIGHMTYPDGEQKDLYYSMRGANPLETIREFTELTTGRSMSGAHPVLGMLMERTFKRRSYSLRPFQIKEFNGSRVVHDSFGGASYIFDVRRGEFVQVHPILPMHLHLLEQFPHYGFVKKTIHPYAQYDDSTPWNPKPIYTKEGKKRIRSRILPFLGLMGVKIYPVDLEGALEWHEKIHKKISSDYIANLLKDPKTRPEILGWLKSDTVVRWMEEEREIMKGELDVVRNREASTDKERIRKKKDMDKIKNILVEMRKSIQTLSRHVNQSGLADNNNR